MHEKKLNEKDDNKGDNRRKYTAKLVKSVKRQVENCVCTRGLLKCFQYIDILGYILEYPLLCSFISVQKFLKFITFALFSLSERIQQGKS